MCLFTEIVYDSYQTTMMIVIIIYTYPRGKLFWPRATRQPIAWLELRRRRSGSEAKPADGACARGTATLEDANGRSFVGGANPYDRSLEAQTILSVWWTAGGPLWKSGRATVYQTNLFKVFCFVCVLDNHVEDLSSIRSSNFSKKMFFSSSSTLTLIWKMLKIGVVYCWKYWSWLL